MKYGPIRNRQRGRFDVPEHVFAQDRAQSFAIGWMVIALVLLIAICVA